ncbi:MAG: class I tRNA ligase family protein, partial [Pikeienuella sp.]
DPLELIDQYGADAVRFTLTSQEVQARRALRLSPTQVEGGRNFGTKLWNAARFAEMNECAVPAGYDPSALTQTVNKWIVGETARAKAALDGALEQYRFNDAANALFMHVRRVFCDWYVEFAKPLLQGEDEEARAETQATMAWALEQCLILLHPIMPFITEDLWAKTANRGGWLMHADWPDYGDIADAAADAEMAWVIGLIEQVRSVRSELNVNAGAKTPLVLMDMSGEALARFERNAVLIQRLARIEGVSMADQGADDVKGAVTLTLEGAVLALPLAEYVDVKAEAARLKKASDKLAKEAGGIEKKLSNEKFLAKAPDEVVEEQRERLTAAKGEQEKLAAAMARLAEMG